MARKRRRSSLRVVIFLGVLVLLLGGGLLAAKWLLSPRFVVDQLAAAVERQTGRKLIVKGRPVLAFWPELSVHLTDVSLSNPPGMAKGTFLRVKALDIAVSARPLLQRKLDIRTIRLTRPEISLLVDAKGRASWDFSNPAGKGGAGGSTSGGGGGAGDVLTGIRLAPIVISDASVRYLDERSGSVFSADKVNLNISLPTPESPLKLKGSAVWRREPVRFSLFIKAPQRLGGAGSPLEAAIEAPRARAVYSGFMGLKKGLELAGRIEASGKSLRGLFAWLGADMPQGRGLGPFSIKSAIGVTQKTVELKKARITLDGMTARGAVRIGAGKHPRISASLGVDRINVNAYMAPPPPPALKTQARGAAPADWSDAPINLSSLKGIDADLRLAAGEILYRKVRIGRSDVTVSLKNGVLDARLTKMALYGGKATGRLILDGSRKKPVVRGALSASGLNGEKLLRDFAGMTAIRGALTATLSLAATGKSQREMVSTLAGKAQISFANGAIRGVNIARLVRTVQGAIVNGWKKAPKEKTDFAELSASFRITDGIAQTHDIKMLGPLVRVTGSGEVDMLRRYLDLRVDPKLVGSLKGQGGKLELTGLPVPVIIKGPWDNPKIYPDIKGILKDPKTAYKNLRGLIARVGGANAGETVDKIKDKAKALGKARQKQLEKAVQKQLGKAVGDQKAEKTVKKAKKKAKKLLKKLFQ